MSVTIVKTATVPVIREWYVQYDDTANHFLLSTVAEVNSTDGRLTARSDEHASDGTNFVALSSDDAGAFATALQAQGYTIIGQVVS